MHKFAKSTLTHIFFEQISMDWIHLGMMGFTKEDVTTNESHRCTNDTRTSRVCNDFKWHSHKYVTKFPMNLWADCSFLTVQKAGSLVSIGIGSRMLTLPKPHQSQTSCGSDPNSMGASHLENWRADQGHLRVFGPLQLYLLALAVTGLNWSRCVKIKELYGLQL